MGRRSTIWWFSSAAVLATIALTMVPDCQAAGGNRAGHSELVIFGESMTSNSTRVQGTGVAIGFDRLTGGGLALGHNFGRFLNLGFDIFVGGSDTWATGGGRSISGSVTCFAVNANAELNLVPYWITPFVRGSAGLMRFEGDWNGVPYSERDFSYGAGVGLRMDITQHLMVKGLYQRRWVNLKDSVGTTEFDGFAAVLGFVF